MVAHRLVQVHRVEDRRIEAGEELLRDDEDLRQFAGFPEVPPDLLLPLPVEVPFLEIRRVVVVSGEDDLRISQWKTMHLENPVQRLLVEGARLAVHGDEEGVPCPCLGRDAIQVEPPPPLGLTPRHIGPPDFLGVCQDAGLDGFVFSGCGHKRMPLS